MESILRSAPVIPILTIQNAGNAIPLARALVAGGIRILEIPLRTAPALEAVAAIAGAVPEIMIGVGTVTDPIEFGRAQEGGARFAISPGLRPGLAAAAKEAGMPYLPGVATASEIMEAVELGFHHLKFFPAEAEGGAALLKTLAGPFPGVRFCPTGGINMQNMARYLKLSNVVSVGGSWIAPQSDIAAGNWEAVTERARESLARVP
jgi:2-dehydro-3-deoxyphosphogluconate aldolase/(4S)-4-hydroxy-2-oxoglutarate aldolase